MSYSRRHFLMQAAAGAVTLSGTRLFSQQVRPGTSLPPWSPGMLDIHHIATGRGNSVLMLCPDGTSIMVDAGAVGGSTEALGPARPNDSRRPGEWIGRYALRHLQAAQSRQLDYFVLSHFHGDHMGDVVASSPVSASGSYRLTGVSDVAETLPIRTLIDRGHPDYDYPRPQVGESVANYIRYSKYASQHGTRVEGIRVGYNRQIALVNNPERWPAFSVRNLAGNGVVWTETGDETNAHFPPLDSLKPEQFPTENACSIALRLAYGAFSYYIGGDLTCDTRFGSTPWMDVESAAAKSAGRTSVAALNHHGYYDATGPAFVRSLQSRIYVLQAWHASHPALAVLEEIYSPILEPGAHDIFATGLVPAAHLADARLSDRMLSQHGHIVVRVAPGGSTYEVYVLDDSREDVPVLGRWGPYSA